MKIHKEVTVDNYIEKKKKIDEKENTISLKDNTINDMNREKNETSQNMQ